ncbi:MAG TPA: heme-binding protein [Microvirga sp.]|nr:heme-binding protein [Microvirga sp.]
MTELTLDLARTIAEAALKTAREKAFKPLSIVVYDARGALKALLSEDGTSLKRAEIAMGKAYGALSLGVGSRAIHKMATDRPFFVAAATHAVGGQLVPVPGGVLIKDAGGRILGAVGVSGDTSDNDEIAAAGGIEAAGLAFDAGA